MSDKMKAVSINKSKTDNQTVAMLEELLEGAKKGDLVSLIFIDGRANGEVGSGWATPNSKMLGELEILKVSLAIELSGGDI